MLAACLQLPPPSLVCLCFPGLVPAPLQLSLLGSVFMIVFTELLLSLEFLVLAVSS